VPATPQTSTVVVQDRYGHPLPPTREQVTDALEALMVVSSGTEARLTSYAAAASAVASEQAQATVG